MSGAGTEVYSYRPSFTSPLVIPFSGTINYV